jgi:hypothetical protein
MSPRRSAERPPSGPDIDNTHVPPNSVADGRRQRPSARAGGVTSPDPRPEQRADHRTATGPAPNAAGLASLINDANLAERAAGVLAAIERALLDGSGVDPDAPADSTAQTLGPEVLSRLLAAGGGAYLVARILNELRRRDGDAALRELTAEQLAERVVALLAEGLTRSSALSSAGNLRWLERLITTLEAGDPEPDHGTPMRSGRQRLNLPDLVPQSTWPEAREITAALTDGPTGRNWRELPQALGLVHALAGSRFRTELVGSAMSEWFGVPATPADLYSELRDAGLPAALLLHVCIAITLEQPGLVEVDLDDLVRAVGWIPRSTNERALMRRRIWRWLTIYAAARVIGERPRRRPYVDPMTGREPRLVSRDSLVMVGGVELDQEQLALDGSEPPITVTLSAGAFPGRYRGNHRVLTYFGNVRSLAAIPAGKPSGAWAQAIGLALNQHWREQAAYVDAGGGASLPPIGRRALLDTFPPAPTVHDVLDGPHPSRARTYFAQAITLLREHGVIGDFREPEPITDRKGWADRWLAQLVHAYPAEEASQAAAAIAQTAARIRGPRTRRRAPAGP